MTRTYSTNLDLLGTNLLKETSTVVASYLRSELSIT